MLFTFMDHLSSVVTLHFIKRMDCNSIPIKICSTQSTGLELTRCREFHSPLFSIFITKKILWYGNKGGDNLRNNGKTRGGP